MVADQQIICKQTVDCLLAACYNIDVGRAGQAADYQEDEMLNETTANLKELLGCTGAVYTAANHVLVDDGATRAIYTAAAAATLAEEWQKNLDRVDRAEADDYDRGQAYSLACSATSALHADQVPADVAEALAEEAGLEVEKLTFGW
jgi:hypothetical protein